MVAKQRLQFERTARSIAQIAIIAVAAVFVLCGLPLVPAGSFLGTIGAQILSDNTPPAPVRNLTKIPPDLRFPRGFFVSAYFPVDEQKVDILNQKFDLIVVSGSEACSGIRPEKIWVETGPSISVSNSSTYPSEWEEINAHEDWFVHSSPAASPETRIAVSPVYPYLFYMDVGSQGWRNFVVSKHTEIVANNPTIDGVFTDGPLEPSEYIAAVGSAYPTYSAPEYEAKTIEFVSAIKSAVGPDKIVILNANLYKPFTVTADGNMNEGFVHFGGWQNSRQESKEQWLGEVANMSDPAFDGKYLLIGSGSLESTIPSMLEYCYASFLLGYNTRAHCYFYWHSNAEGGYSTLNWFPLWEMELGEPQSAYSEAGGIYKRDFAQGIVLVNPNDAGEPVTVNLNGTYLDSTGNVVSIVTLPNKSGAVLKKYTWFD